MRKVKENFISEQGSVNEECLRTNSINKACPVGKKVSVRQEKVSISHDMMGKCLTEEEDKLE